MSRLYLRAEKHRDRTVITESTFTAPLKIASPFYHRDYTEIMMMSASAGMLEGDEYDIRIHVCEGASLKFTGQSYNKIFRCPSGHGVTQHIKLTVERGGKLLYCPHPVIPFKESRFRNVTEAELTEGAVLVIQDVFACGRTAMNESFQFTEYRSRTSVRKNGKLIFLDNVRMCPKEINLYSTGFFEGNTRAGMMYVTGSDISDLPDGLKNAAVTETTDGKCIRILSDQSQEITDVFDRILKTG